VTVTVSFRLAEKRRAGDQGGDLRRSGDSTAALETLSRNDAILTFNTVVSVDNVDRVDVEGSSRRPSSTRCARSASSWTLAIQPYEDASG